MLITELNKITASNLIKAKETIVMYNNKQFIIVANENRDFRLYDISDNHIASFDAVTNLVKKIKTIK